MLSIDEIIEKYSNRKVIIFGAGNDGSDFYKRTYGKLNVLCFVDNARKEQDRLYGKKICGYSYIQQKRKNELVVVATYKYYKEIQLQLNKDGLRELSDYVIWNITYSNESDSLNDENMKSFINLNQKLWIQHTNNTKNKIIIPYRRTLELTYAQWSYFANLLAQKYDANIYCAGGVRDFFEKDMLKIYESFNCKSIIDETLDDLQKKERDYIFQNTYPNIKNQMDLRKLSIYGYDFGIDILRDYLRLEYPIFLINDLSFWRQLREMIGYIVFWHDYFNKNYKTIKTVIVWDGLYYREGIIRKIAFKLNIPVYSVTNITAFKWGYDIEDNFLHYKNFFASLSEEDKQSGMDWARKKLEKHLNGSGEDILMPHKSIFSAHGEADMISSNEKTKVLICPHYFEDDPFPYGDKMLFADQWEWLNYLGKLSLTSNYEWYLKPHPLEKEFGDELIKEYIHKYHNIKLLPKYISPKVLQKAGIKYALTIHGSIGYEYPLIGINVINAGHNPHVSFDFDINPQTFEEYEELLMKLDKIVYKPNLDEILQFYCIHFGYCMPHKQDYRKKYFKNEILQDIRGLVGSKTQYSTELFKIYVDEIDEERHKQLLEIYKNIIEQIDSFRFGVFQKVELKQSVNLHL